MIVDLANRSDGEERAAVPPDRIAVFTEQVVALRVHQRVGPRDRGLDGMTVFGQFRDPAGKLHAFDFWFQDPEHARSIFVRRVYELAVDLLHDERSVRVLENLHGYLGLGLPVKHQPGRPHVLRIFGRLTSSERSELESSLAQVPEDVPLLFDLSNFDGMGTLLYETFREFLRRSGPTVSWAMGEEARMQLQAIGVAGSAIFLTREEALAALSGG